VSNLSRPFSLCLALSLSALAPDTHAQGAATDTAAAAETLFREGRAAMEKGDYAAACPKLASSYELDPGTGALLALALCYEESGKLASAWSAYVEAEARSKRENRPERAESARGRIDALEPRLPRLTIRVSDEVAALPGVRIERNGSDVAKPALGTSVPVDPGKQTIVLSAPGYESITKVVQSVEGQPLEVLFDTVPTQLSSQPSTGTDRGGLGGLAIAGLVTGGAGVVALGIGGAFGVVAMGKNADSDAGCDQDDVCNPQGFRDRVDARSAGDLSTVFFVAGGVLAGAGATMFVLGLGEEGDEPATVAAYPMLGPDRVGLVLGGKF
jgi:hypothetical protein